jgi:hypothetical protein
MDANEPWAIHASSVLLRGKPVVRVRNILGDDVYGLWHVKKIVVHKAGQRFAVIPKKETFSTKDEAEHYAHLRTRRFVELGLAWKNNNTVQWSAAITYLCIAGFISAMTAVAVQWWRDQPSHLL